MKTTVDARGLACPQPVVLTMKAIANAEHVTVIVDNQAAIENVTRLARSRGFSVDVRAASDGTYLDLGKADATGLTDPVASPVSQVRARSDGGTRVVFVPSDCLGRGSAELGERLLAAFFLCEGAARPDAIVFMNSGVKLAATGARSIEDLGVLSAHGVDILVCGTCLSYFELSDKLAVGRVSNMYEIAALLLDAGTVVQL
jgi:selenium metabolism protein YedF